uniref:Uncharacterized protein n=1 Tax=Cyclophora tenuis TaxID=216820 RepID=A0A7S1GKL5_CYCTE|mmetsp:Transcript_19726/g.33690  ORF Transcript_19726/g.33690 Transcript_19726/m.33690 type:complete len:120 (+) Transcript_19726:6-365(+)
MRKKEPDPESDKKKKSAKPKAEQPVAKKRRTDEFDPIQVYLLPTTVDKSTQTLRSTGVRMIPDVNSLPVGAMDAVAPSAISHKKSTSLDFTPALSSEEGVSDFFPKPPSISMYGSETEA